MRLSKKTYAKRRKDTKKRKTKRNRIKGGTFKTPEKQKPAPHDQNAPEKLGKKSPVPNRFLFDVREQIGKKGDEIRHTYDGNPGIEADLDAYIEGHNDAMARRVSNFHYSEMGNHKNNKYIDEYKKGYNDGKLKADDYDADDEDDDDK
jgi:hypothetical protein